jgi:bla regulator protein BlaR1
MMASSLSEMCKAIAPALGNHLWQSTLFVIAAGLLTLILRNNHARTRYLLWLTASVKFLIPFSLLAGVAGHIAWRRSSADANAGVYIAMDQLSRPFSQSRMSLISEAKPVLHSHWIDLLPPMVAAVWLCGVAVVVLAWYVRWRRISAVMRKAVPLRVGREVESVRSLERAAGMSKRIEIRVSRTSLEPGVFGIVRPILVWPHGISARLEKEHLEVIVAHELCHVRRRDNLSAGVHMAVEALFWFHPIVWWLGARLLQERERACDEQVLELGSDRQVYAESILKICEFCVGSPLDFVSGVTGADLKKRIVHIMARSVVQKLDFGRKLLLGAAGLTAIAIPIVFGLLHAAQSRAESPAQVAGIIPPVYEAVSIEPASIKPNKPGVVSSRMMFHPGEFTATNVTLQELIGTVYGVDDLQISGAPDWLDSEKFDIDAKWDKSVLDAIEALSPEQLARERKHMLQEFLADRFKLTLHRETQHLPVYELVIAKNGPKLHEAKPDDTYPNGFNDADGRARAGMMHLERGQLTAQGVPVVLLRQVLARELLQEFGGGIIVDKTGLTGNYDFTLKWTPEESQPAIFRGTDGGQQGADSSPAPESSRPSLFRSLQEQLGLKLERQNSPGEILVIDHVEKPATLEAQSTYARSPVFQVVSIEANKSSNPMRAITARSDELKVTNFTLRMLILKAYGVQGYQLSGGPDWLDSENYDIEAKMDSTAAEELGKLNMAQRNSQTLRMLQSLLVDRFKLALHSETEELPVYGLVIAKDGPKFREAIPGDTYPNGITGLGGRPIGGGGISEPERGKLVGQGCPIAYLADALSQEDLGRTVRNKTGLAGNYDFTLQWTPEARKGPADGRPAKFNNYGEFFNTPPKNNLNNGAQVAVRDSSGPSIFTAIQEQLGLKLEPQTTPLELLVIDHAEKPPEN